jgi:hypothetical protein
VEVGVKEIGSCRRESDRFFVLRVGVERNRNGGIVDDVQKVMQGVPSESLRTDQVPKCGRWPEVPT